MSNAWRFSVVCVLAAASSAIGRSQVYEGFQYPTGEQPLSSLHLGTGWSGAFTGSPSSAPISSPSLIHPSALPSTGAALGITTDSSGLSLQRTVAAPLDAGEEFWVSFLAQQTNFPSAATLRLGGGSGPGISFFIGGYGIVAGLPQYVPWPDSVSGTFMLLARFAPEGGGQQRIDLWLNPAGSLGQSDLSVVTAASGVNDVQLQISSFTLFDELRIDRQLQNVYVPAVGTVMPLGMLIAFTCRRKRGSLR